MHFTIEELTKTNQNIDNTPTKEAKDNLQILIDNLLEGLRTTYGKPIIINSGYRSPAVNEAVGGSSTSGHLLGTCADITGGSIEENKILFNLIKDNFEFRQLIWELGGKWIHVEYREGDNKKQILEAIKKKGKTIYKNIKTI